MLEHNEGEIRSATVTWQEPSPMQMIRGIRNMYILLSVMVIVVLLMAAYLAIWEPHLKHDYEQRAEMQRQFRIEREAEMLIAPPYWTVTDDYIEAYSLTPPTGSFDQEIEMPVPRKALSTLWKDGEFRDGVERKKIKFHFRKGYDARTATDEWDLIEASIVR